MYKQVQLDEQKWILETIRYDAQNKTNVVSYYDSIMSYMTAQNVMIVSGIVLVIVIGAYMYKNMGAGTKESGREIAELREELKELKKAQEIKYNNEETQINEKIKDIKGDLMEEVNKIKESMEKQNKVLDKILEKEFKLEELVENFKKNQEIKKDEISMQISEQIESLKKVQENVERSSYGLAVLKQMSEKKIGKRMEMVEAGHNFIMKRIASKVVYLENNLPLEMKTLEERIAILEDLFSFIKGGT